MIGTSETLFYIVKTDDDKYSVFNMLTDKIILNDVNKLEAKKFLERNNPMHPTLVFTNPGDPLGISFGSPLVSPTGTVTGYCDYISPLSYSDTYTYDSSLDDAYESIMEFSFNKSEWRCEWDPPQPNENINEKDNLINFVRRKRKEDILEKLEENKDEEDYKN